MAWRDAMRGSMGQPFGMLMPSQLPGAGGQGLGAGQQMGGMLSPYLMPGFQQQMNRPQQPTFQPAPQQPPAGAQAQAQPPTPQPIPAMPAGGFGSPDAKMGWANQANTIIGQNQAAQTAYQQQQPGATQPSKDPMYDYWLNFNYGGSGV